jgi:hypothetical protein
VSGTRNEIFVVVNSINLPMHKYVPNVTAQQVFDRIFDVMIAAPYYIFYSYTFENEILAFSFRLNRLSM